MNQDWWDFHERRFGDNESSGGNGGIRSGAFSLWRDIDKLK